MIYLKLRRELLWTTISTQNDNFVHSRQFLIEFTQLEVNHVIQEPSEVHILEHMYTNLVTCYSPLLLQDQYALENKSFWSFVKGKNL